MSTEKARRRPSIAIATIMAFATFLPAPPAHAQSIGGGNWAIGFSSWTCTSGNAERTCSYDFSTLTATTFVETCQEVAVSGVPLVNCHAEVHMTTVKIVAIVNASNNVIGCQSKPFPEQGDELGWGSFDSGTNPAYDNNNIPVVDIEVYDIFNDGIPTETTVVARDQEGLLLWELVTQMNVECGKNATGSNTLPAPGSVSIQRA
jgi:hypothetical protein